MKNYIYKQQVKEVNNNLEDLTQAIEMLKTPNSRMIQKSNEVLKNEINSRGAKKKYATNKTDVYHFDNISSLDILDFKGYIPENNRGYRCVSVIFENFNKFGWTTPLKNKNAQITKDSLDTILIGSKSKPNLIESDRGKDFHNNIFKNA